MLGGKQLVLRSISLTASVAASSTATLLSPEIKRKHRPLAILFWAAASATGSWFSIFVTRSETPVSEPQPGDPPIIWANRVQTFGTNPITIPTFVQEAIEEGTRIACVFFNNATSAATIVLLYIYQEVIPTE